MRGLYVTDTNSLISYFHCFFNQPATVSDKALGVIEAAITRSGSEVRLSVPSVVFVEIYEKWLRSEELARKFHYQVYIPLRNSPNVEIKPIEQEVLENLLKIDDNMLKHEVHDKIILASAMMLCCPLITSDTAIIKYVEKHKVIPEVVT